MDKQEYIIINKTAIQKRIEELEVLIQELYKIHKEHRDSFWKSQMQGYLDEKLILKRIISQSTPLNPEIEKAYYEGFDYGEGNHKSLSKQDYISSLKLDI